jgi:hypothetical protein
MTSMRHPAIVTALVLALLSGFVLAQLWSMDPIRLRTIQAVPSAQVEATTLAFYQGVNLYLDEGNDDALREMLHPEFVNHQPNGSASGNNEGYFQQLDSIRRFYPGIQIETRVTPLSSSAASVALSWTTVAQQDFAGIALDPGDLIGRLDLLRIERGLIVERWSSAVLTGQLDAFPALSIELPFALDTMVARVRQIPLQGDYEPNVSQFGHLLLIDLSGEAFLEVLRPASISAMLWKQNRGRAADPTPIEPGGIVELGRMEAIFVPASTTFRMWDAGDQDAELIALEFGPPVSGELPPSGPLLTYLRTTLWSGIELKGVGDRLNLSFGRAELLPEAMLSNPEVSGIELTWVTSGTLDMTASQGEARVRAASGLRFQLIDGHAVLWAGDAGAAGLGADITYQASGESSSTVWFFSLVATPDRPISDAANTPAVPPTTPTPPPPRNFS